MMKNSDTSHLEYQERAKNAAIEFSNNVKNAALQPDQDDLIHSIEASLVRFNEITLASNVKLANDEAKKLNQKEVIDRKKVNGQKKR